MDDERALIERLEAANTAELADILRRPGRADEAALRNYLGEALYERLHRLALTCRPRNGKESTRHVVVIPGLVGSVLTAVNQEGQQERIWVRSAPIMAGKLEYLMLDEDGHPAVDPTVRVEAAGIMKRQYGELLLSLAQQWDARAFWFDWRRDLRHTARRLDEQLGEWFDPSDHVDLVTHSIGGVVARLFIELYPEHWNSMRGRLIQLGAPNAGLFAILETFLGVGPTVGILDELDHVHGPAFFRRLARSFPGFYQLLPSPYVVSGIDDVYSAQFYGDLDVPQRLLTRAMEHHQRLTEPLDDTVLARIDQILGYGFPTIKGIRDLNEAGKRGWPDPYTVTLEGDGFVAHALGRLPTAGVAKTPLYVRASHVELTSDQRVLAALSDLLTQGQTGALETTLPPLQESDAPPAETHKGLVDALLDIQQRGAEQAGKRATRLFTPVNTEANSPYISDDERDLEEFVTYRMFTVHKETAPPRSDPPPFDPAPIHIRLMQGNIVDVHTQASENENDRPVDAVAVGHYMGMAPAGPVAALDRALSRALLGQNGADQEPSMDDRLLYQYSQRGILRGDLGVPFFLDDPRDGGATRVITVAGLGLPGRLGKPEMTVVARELCWAVGRLGKKHLATVLIGAGPQNMSVRDAVNAWMRGLKHAISGTDNNDRWRLEYITFVELDGARLLGIDQALQREVTRLKDRLNIDYQWVKTPAPPATPHASSPTESADAALDTDETAPSTRVTVRYEDGRYLFGAITRAASIPEREIQVDQKLVQDVNDKLAGEWDPSRQVDLGRTLGYLLLPADLSSEFYTDDPLVMMLDAETARIHWEMLAQPDQASVGTESGQFTEADKQLYFLGTSRSFTRQLRTLFAPPPDPPLPRRRVLRVLVVADPAEDRPLPNAQLEGYEVADLFERYNTLHHDSENRVEVVRLVGPHQATRLGVIEQLVTRSYDVLHFAGHCVYDRDNLARSGWIFSNGERLTARELNRIDRIPNFVFSNACESGVTPDRAERRSVELAPSFAEAFFARGVTSFVCTAWPIADRSARLFALKLYARLLGVPVGEDGDQLGHNQASLDELTPQPIHIAMRDARNHIFGTSSGTRTWGAYQHYGYPHMRFFHTPDMKHDA